MHCFERIWCILAGLMKCLIIVRSLESLECSGVVEIINDCPFLLVEAGRMLIRENSRKTLRSSSISARRWFALLFFHIPILSRSPRSQKEDSGTLLITLLRLSITTSGFSRIRFLISEKLSVRRPEVFYDYVLLL